MVILLSGLQMIAGTISAQILMPGGSMLCDSALLKPSIQSALIMRPFAFQMSGSFALGLTLITSFALNPTTGTPLCETQAAVAHALMLMAPSLFAPDILGPADSKKMGMG